MKNRENYNEIVSFIKREARYTKKQGYFVYDILDFLIEAEENLVNGNSKIANKIYENEIDYKSGDNSYNYCSNINNDINYLIYDIDDKTYVKLKLHKFEDIRNHYSDEIIFKFESKDEFLELLSETTLFYQIIKIDENSEIFLSCNIFDELIEVNLETLNHVDYSNNIDINFSINNHTIKEIKEKLIKYYNELL